MTAPQTGMNGLVGLADSPRPCLIIWRSWAAVSDLPTCKRGNGRRDASPALVAVTCEHANWTKTCAPAATCGLTVDACWLEAAAIELGCFVSRPRKKPTIRPPSPKLTAIITINPEIASDPQSRLFTLADSPPMLGQAYATARPGSFRNNAQRRMPATRCVRVSITSRQRCGEADGRPGGSARVSARTARAERPTRPPQPARNAGSATAATSSLTDKIVGVGANKPACRLGRSHSQPERLHRALRDRASGMPFEWRWQWRWVDDRIAPVVERDPLWEELGAEAVSIAVDRVDRDRLPLLHRLAPAPAGLRATGRGSVCLSNVGRRRRRRLSGAGDEACDAVGMPAGSAARTWTSSARASAERCRCASVGEQLERRGDRRKPVDTRAALARALAGEIAKTRADSATAQAGPGTTITAPAPSVSGRQPKPSTSVGGDPPAEVATDQNRREGLARPAVRGAMSVAESRAELDLVHAGALDSARRA